MWRAEGLQKSGKTLVFAGIAFAFGYGFGYNVFTNMTSCKYRPPGSKRDIHWATTITQDELFRDMAQRDKRKWRVRDGFLLVDEAPTWFLKGAQGTSNVGQILARCSVQLMKHNIKLLYTSHLADMMPGYVDHLTEQVFECKTDDGGEHVAFRVYDNQRRLECYRYGIPWGERDKAHWWVPGRPFFDIYDYEEGMDIFASDMSDFAGASGRRRRRLLSGEPTQQQYPTASSDIQAIQAKISELQTILAKGSNGALGGRQGRVENLRNKTLSIPVSG